MVEIFQFMFFGLLSIRDLRIKRAHVFSNNIYKIFFFLLSGPNITMKAKPILTKGLLAFKLKSQKHFVQHGQYGTLAAPADNPYPHVPFFI